MSELDLRFRLLGTLEVRTAAGDIVPLPAHRPTCRRADDVLRGVAPPPGPARSRTRA
ncbi:hypothetical protein [Kribbella yunnanensis]|uniref:hypothetical protein n=1 Tax=Kribbella yunnanensis TaxID=190194 RepID=UPI0031E3A24E